VFDREGRGYFQVGEFKQLMRGLGEAVSEEELQEMVRVGDPKETNRIYYEEFVSQMVNQ
jgi:Ca2+-binding EF-hand superfamily protein